MRAAKAKMSLVRHIFTNRDYVYVVYEGPVDRASRFWLHVFTLNGDSVDNFPIPGQPGIPMWFDGKSNVLYSIGKTGENGYSVLKYIIKIKDKFK